jgi:hypothetical protein
LSARAMQMYKPSTAEFSGSAFVAKAAAVARPSETTSVKTEARQVESLTEKIGQSSRVYDSAQAMHTHRCPHSSFARRRAFVRHRQQVSPSAAVAGRSANFAGFTIGRSVFFRYVSPIVFGETDLVLPSASRRSHPMLLQNDGAPGGPNDGSAVSAACPGLAQCPAGPFLTTLSLKS